tara:strand:+ start:101 stop:391 length:291 start_codon:yes stop_codon:yes gene_type:complete
VSRKSFSFIRRRVCGFPLIRFFRNSSLEVRLKTEDVSRRQTHLNAVTTRAKRVSLIYLLRGHEKRGNNDDERGFFSRFYHQYRVAFAFVEKSENNT